MSLIARKLGLSTVTVSCALRGTGRVAPETRRRVLEEAEKAGYRPNPLITALMTNLRRSYPGSRCTLAFLTCFPTADEWMRFRPGFVDYRNGAIKRAEMLGYRLETHWLGEVEWNARRMSKVLRARGIPGVILAPLPRFGMPIGLEWAELATVAIGHSFNEFPAHRVANHQYHSMLLALAHLVRSGYRRIGLVMTDGDNDKTEGVWVASYKAGIHRMALPRVVPLTMPALKPNEVVAWVRRRRLEAVISTHDRIGVWLKAAGFSVPDEIGFAHLDWHASRRPVLAGVNQRGETIGAAAVDLLIEQLNNNEVGVPATPKCVLMEGQWQEGPTVRSPRAAVAVTTTA